MGAVRLTSLPVTVLSSYSLFLSVFCLLLTSTFIITCEEKEEKRSAWSHVIFRGKGEGVSFWKEERHHTGLVTCFHKLVRNGHERRQWTVKFKQMGVETTISLQICKGGRRGWGNLKRNKRHYKKVSSVSSNKYIKIWNHFFTGKNITAKSNDQRYAEFGYTRYAIWSGRNSKQKYEIWKKKVPIAFFVFFL